MISKTYQLGLLQARAYRLLRERTKIALKPFDITDIDWSIMGLLADSPNQTPKELAAALSVKIPFISRICKDLETKNIIERLDHEQDNRSFYYHLSSKGEKMTTEIEPQLRKALAPLVSPLSAIQIRGYVKTLEKIVHNSQKTKNR